MIGGRVDLYGVSLDLMNPHQLLLELLMKRENHPDYRSGDTDLRFGRGWNGLGLKPNPRLGA
jgi:hypothetical protein